MYIRTRSAIWCLTSMDIMSRASLTRSDLLRKSLALRNTNSMRVLLLKVGNVVGDLRQSGRGIVCRGETAGSSERTAG